MLFEHGQAVLVTKSWVQTMPHVSSLNFRQHQEASNRTCGFSERRNMLRKLEQ